MSQIHGHFSLTVRRDAEQPDAVVGDVHGYLVTSLDQPRLSRLVFTPKPEMLDYFHRWSSEDFSARQIRIRQYGGGLVWKGTFMLSKLGEIFQLQNTGDLTEESAI